MSEIAENEILQIQTQQEATDYWWDRNLDQIFYQTFILKQKIKIQIRNEIVGIF